jgi:hypothetical protein
MMTIKLIILNLTFLRSLKIRIGNKIINNRDDNKIINKRKLENYQDFINLDLVNQNYFSKIIEA